MGEQFKVHRKLWEFAAIAEVFHEVRTEAVPKALGFGVGKEPLAAWLAYQGCHVLATDHPAPTAAWTATGQHAASLADLRWRGICDENTFRSSVSYAAVDMRDIPPAYDGLFDFIWSCGSFEHLGGLKAGAEFVCRAMRCLVPGGIAAHTTEYNFGSGCSDAQWAGSRALSPARPRGDRTDDRQSRATICGRSTSMPGTEPVDRMVDEAPYKDEPHLALRTGGCLTTSVLLVVERGGEG